VSVAITLHWIFYVQESQLWWCHLPKGRENEQMNRARRLESLGALRVLPEDELNSQRLADEIHALLCFTPQSVNFNLDGARISARIMAELVRRRNLDRAKFRP